MNWQISTWHLKLLHFVQSYPSLLLAGISDPKQTFMKTIIQVLPIYFLDNPTGWQPRSLDNKSCHNEDRNVLNHLLLLVSVFPTHWTKLGPPTATGSQLPSPLLMVDHTNHTHQYHNTTTTTSTTSWKSTTPPPPHPRRITERVTKRNPQRVPDENENVPPGL